MMGTRRAAVNAAVCDAVPCKRAWACRDSTRRGWPCRASKAFAVPHTRQGRRESSPTSSPDRVRAARYGPAGSAPPAVRELQVQLLFEVAQVLGCAPVVAAKYLVAGAAVADRGTQRQVRVKRQRAREAADAAPRQPGRMRRRITGLNKTVGSGIRGVARAGRVATGNRLAVDFNPLSRLRHGGLPMTILRSGHYAALACAGIDPPIDPPRGCHRRDDAGCDQSRMAGKTLISHSLRILALHQASP